MVGGVLRAAAASAYANGLPWAAVTADLSPAAVNAHGGGGAYSAARLLGRLGILRGGEESGLSLVVRGTSGGEGDGRAYRNRITAFKRS